MRMGAGSCTPGRGMQPGTHGSGHQLVIGRVKLHLVDALAKTVEAAQLRRSHIGQSRVRLHVRATAQGPERGQRTGIEIWRMQGQRRAQALIAVKQVVVDQWQRLVENFVGDGGHGFRALPAVDRRKKL